MKNTTSPCEIFIKLLLSAISFVDSSSQIPSHFLVPKAPFFMVTIFVLFQL